MIQKKSPQPSSSGIDFIDISLALDTKNNLNGTRHEGWIQDESAPTLKRQVVAGDTNAKASRVLRDAFAMCFA